MTWQWWLIVFILSHIALATGVEVILDPYAGLEYDKINVYTFDDSDADCTCQNNDFTYYDF